MPRIMIVPVGERPRIEMVEKLDLEDMQKLVGGYIERLQLWEDQPAEGTEIDELVEQGVDLWANENGIADELPYNRHVRGIDHQLHAIHGQFFIVRTAAGEDGEPTTVDLTDEDIERTRARFDYQGKDPQ